MIDYLALALEEEAAESLLEERILLPGRRAEPEDPEEEDILEKRGRLTRAPVPGEDMPEEGEQPEGTDRVSRPEEAGRGLKIPARPWLLPQTRPAPVWNGFQGAEVTAGKEAALETAAAGRAGPWPEAVSGGLSPRALPREERLPGPWWEDPESQTREETPWFGGEESAAGPDPWGSPSLPGSARGSAALLRTMALVHQAAALVRRGGGTVSLSAPESAAAPPGWDLAELDQLIRRDARRYDGDFTLY